MATPEIEKQFLIAATWHGSLEQAEQLLIRYPELAEKSIHTAAVLGNAEAIKRFSEVDPSSVKSLAQAYGANALTLLGLSKYLRFGAISEDHFLAAAQMLIDAGADVNAGFTTAGPYPEYETPLYGVAGVAHNAKLTSLLIRYGADPNDVEAVYHSPETYDNDAMKVLVETGQITEEHLTLMLIRKHDLHDLEGVKYLLEKGVSPNGRWNNVYPLHHALLRINHIDIIKLLIDFGADPYVVQNDFSAMAHAASEGRGDVLRLLESKDFDIALAGKDQLIAACALGSNKEVMNLIQTMPELPAQIKQVGGYLLARFAAAGNVEGIGCLIHCGIPVNSRYEEGDPYYQIPKGSLPIHVAAWLGYPQVVKLLVEKGSVVDEADAKGETPLALAVKACINSYWMHRRSPDSVKALLDAGANARKIVYPTGYEEVDLLLKAT